MDARSHPGGITAAQLKADIDRGLAGDKIAANDPGLAPLGTDEEAAGTPTPPDAMATILASLREIGLASGARPRPLWPEPRGHGPRWTMAGLFWAAGAVLAAAVLASLMASLS